MKTLVLSLLALCILPARQFAQVTISTNEYYENGDAFQMMNAGIAGTDAGAAGANVTWDFSSLTGATGPVTTRITNNTSGTFSTSNLIIKMANGMHQYVLENNNDTYLNAIVDSNTGIVVNYYNFNLSKRPISYMTAYVDTYNISIPSTGLHGLGTQNTVVDGWGTVITPAGTYNNALRVKRTQFETDSIGSTVYTTTTMSYMWYDALHAAPLMRIDSVIGIIGAGTTVMYLTPSLGVKNLSAAENNYKCFFHDNNLRINGNFATNKMYQVKVYDMIGAVVYSGDFVANNFIVNLDISRNTAPGMYVVNIAQKDGVTDKGVIKVMKQ